MPHLTHPSLSPAQFTLQIISLLNNNLRIPHGTSTTRTGTAAQDMAMAGTRRLAALLLLLGLAATAALATRDVAHASGLKSSPAGKKPGPNAYLPPGTKPSIPPGTKPSIPPGTKPGSGGGGVGAIPGIPGIGSIPGFNVPGMGGGWGGGFGGPGGGYSRGGVVAPTVVCSEKGPCYKKKVTCPKKCFSSYSSSGKGYGGGGGGGGCTVDCKIKCIAYC